MIFQTQNPWMLAAGAGHNLGQTYAQTLTDIARIRAMQSESAQNRMMQQQELAQRNQQWERMFGLQRDRMTADTEQDNIRNQFLNLQMQGEAAKLNRQNQGAAATSNYAQNLGSLLMPQAAPDMIARPAEQRMSFGDASLQALNASGNPELVDREVLTHLQNAYKTSGQAGLGGDAGLAMMPIGSSGLAVGVKQNPNGEMTVIPGTLAQAGEQGGYSLLSEQLDLPTQIKLWQETANAYGNYPTGANAASRSNALFNVQQLMSKLPGVQAPAPTTNAPRVRRYNPATGRIE